MSVSGYLLPFPDPGAADLMSDHLEQDVQAAGPGKLRLRVSLPGTRFDEAGSPAQTGTRFARKKLKYSKQQRTAGPCSGARPLTATRWWKR